jgi:hypothetical protein
MFTEETRKDIENAIVNYCEGITWLEFNENDFPNIINDVEEIVKELNLHNVSNNEVAVCECCGYKLSEPYAVQNNTKLCLDCAGFTN